MITPEQHAEIRRLYYGEHWKVGTIAAALGVHHDTVRAAIAHDTQGLRRGTCRATRLDPYLPFIRDTLANHSAGTAFVKLQQDGLSNPWPGLVFKLWRASHPPLGERIQFSNDYSFGIESSLSGPPIADFRAFTGSGVQRYDRLTIGMLWRF